MVVEPDVIIGRSPGPFPFGVGVRRGAFSARGSNVSSSSSRLLPTGRITLALIAATFPAGAPHAKSVAELRLQQ